MQCQKFMMIVVSAVVLSLLGQASDAERPGGVLRCPGTYEGHLQGIAVDTEGNIYWSFTVALVKTDALGTLLWKSVVPDHHGDLWVDGSTVYAAVNHRAVHGEPGKRDSWIYAYKTDDLSLLWKKKVSEVVSGAGALTKREGHFFIASGRLLRKSDANYVYEYDEDCTFMKRHLLDSGATLLGIQTMAYIQGTWWFGCYGTPPETLCANENLTFEKRFDYDCSMGIAPLPGGGFYIGRGKRTPDRRNIGWLIEVDQPMPEDN